AVRARRPPRPSRGGVRLPRAPRGPRSRACAAGPSRAPRRLRGRLRLGRRPDPLVTRIAFLFPGQGSQAVGMGKGFYTTSASAKAVFEEANDALGFDLARLMFEGPEADLPLAADTQPAVLTASVAASAG